MINKQNIGKGEFLIVILVAVFTFFLVHTTLLSFLANFSGGLFVEVFLSMIPIVITALIVHWVSSNILGIKSQTSINLYLLIAFVLFLMILGAAMG